MRAIRYGHRWIQANPAIRSNSPAYRFGASYSGQWPSNQYIFLILYRASLNGVAHCDIYINT